MTEKKPRKGSKAKRPKADDSIVPAGAAPPKRRKGKKQEVRSAKKLDMSTFEKKIRVRPITEADHGALIDLGSRVFPGMEPWTHEHLRSQLAQFPEGQLCVEFDGQIVASSASLIVDFSSYGEWHDWTRIADDGFIRNHDPEGDTLYGIEMMVDPEFRGRKLSRRLYDARKELARSKNLQRIVIGGRIPNYGAHAEELTAREYAEHVLGRHLYDPVLTPQLANGFVLRGLIADYLEDDPDSRGYATHLEWTNLDYRPEGPKQLRAVSLVRVCAVQWQMRTISSFEEFTQQITFYVDVASDYRCDFVTFPEMFTLELLRLVEPAAPGLAARQLAEYTPEYIELMTDLAVRYHINIIGGSQFTLEGESLYNIAYLFRRDGTVGKQYKLHVTPNERRWWGISPGARQEVFDTDRGRIAINVCYDVEFPELARYAAHHGARLLFVPFNTNDSHGYYRVRHCAQARCIENHMYTVISGCVGHLPFVENADIHYAQSAIFSPCDISFSQAGVASEASANIAQMAMHDVDIELVRRHRHAGTTHNWKDRRTDLYRVVFQEDDGTVEV